MTTEIDAGPLIEAFGDLSESEAMDVAGRWFTRSQEYLRQRGDAAGYEYFSILQAAQPPQNEDGVIVFSYPHEATEYMEFGTDAHKITPTNADMLAFEWEDAPQEVREMFEDTFPVVFFPEVEVEGVDELRFIRDSRADVAAEVGRG